MIIASLDIETLSTRQRAVILGIGITKLDMRDSKPSFERLVARGIHVYPTLHSQTLRHTCPDTVNWWREQDQELFNNYMYPGGTKSPAEIHADLEGYLDGVERVYARGPHFDIGILGDFFQQNDLEEPWHYASIRDSRTLLDFMDVDWCPEGIKHHALHDAARELMACYDVLKVEQRSITELEASDNQWNTPWK